MERDEPIVSLVDVGKQYVKYDDVPTLITGLLRRPRTGRRSKLWAVRHVDLEVERGEAVGVIGRNGAGKSTMLAMLAGVTAPTEGVVAVRGRVAPLLSLGVGFHEELTGRENVYINATILGLSEKEIDRAFDDIVAFAELEEFIDTPVKFYSSGMEARLGFSVAVAVHPDVLIVDEILSVGDIGFQARSFERMMSLQREGATILVVSHSLNAVARLCSRVLVLQEGRPKFLGPAPDAISYYHKLLRTSWDERGQPSDVEGTAGLAPIEVVNVELLDESGSATSHFRSRTHMEVRLRLRFRRAVTHPAAGFWLMNAANQFMYAGNCLGRETGTFEAGSEAEFHIRLGLHLANGTYTLGPWVAWGQQEDRVFSVPPEPFYVSGGPRRGVVNLGATFDVIRTPTNAADATDSRASASDPQGP